MDTKGSNTKIVSPSCVIYCRVSSEEQVSNYSLSTQEAYCTKEAERQNLNILKVFKDEGYSAKTLKRPQLLQLLKYCQDNKKKVSKLIVYKLDRLSRETSDYLAIRKRLAEFGIKIVSTQEPTGDTAVDKFFEVILASIGELDNNLKSERTKAGLRARFLDGWFSGKPPLGYLVKSIDGKQTIVKDPQTFDSMKKAWELAATGTKSLHGLAVFMNKLGLRASWKDKKYPLRPQTAGRIFRNKFYCGYLTSKIYSEEVMGKHPAMIREETYWRVQAVLNGHTVNTNLKRIRDNVDFPLRGLVECDRGHKLTAAWCKGRHKKYALYWCPNPEHKTSSIPADKLEEKFVAFLRSITPTERTKELFLAILKRKYYQKLGKLKAFKLKADKELLDLKEMRSSLAFKHLKGQYDDETFNQVKERINDNILAVQVIKDETLIDKYDIEAIVNFARSLLADLGKAYLLGDLSQRKVLIGSIFTGKVVFSEGEFLNRSISLLYQAIREPQTLQNALRVGEGIRTPDLKLHRLPL